VTSRDLTLGVPGGDGATFAAWLVEPSENDRPQPGCGVLLLTDNLGHENEETREFAVALADAGLPVLVPDLFRGEPWQPSRPQAEYEKWRVGHPDERVAADVRAAASVLRRDLGVTSLGMLGFCFGGGRLMDELAMREDGVNPVSAVVYYPTRFDARAAGKKATCSLMAVFGEKDKLVPQSVVDELQDGLGENEEMEECELMLFENAGHAFAHHPKSEQDEDDGEILKSQTADWFTERLGKNH
jgi:carboxymethylenebutenolidase